MTEHSHEHPVVVRATFEEAPCRCVSRHSPKPSTVEHHHVWPQYDQISKHGMVVDRTTVPLCGTGHTAVHDAVRRGLKGEPLALGNTYLRRIAEAGLRKIQGAEA